MKFEIAVKNNQKFSQFVDNTQEAVNNQKSLNNQLQRSSSLSKKLSDRQKNISFGDQQQSLQKFDGEVRKVRSSMYSMFGVEQLEMFGNKISNLKNIGLSAFGKMSKAAMAFMVKIAPLTLALGAVALVFKTIQKAFQWNIGGIAGTWAQSIGKFKEALGKLQIATMKLFRALAPVFKVIGGVLQFVLNVVIKLIEGITKLFNLISGNRDIMGATIGAGAQGGGVTNNNNVTVISNRPIDEKGAKGFEERLNNSVY